MPYSEKQIAKIERTLIRLKHSLNADTELEERKVLRQAQLAANEKYVIDVPQLLSGSDQE